MCACLSFYLISTTKEIGWSCLGECESAMAMFRMFLPKSYHLKAVGTFGMIQTWPETQPTETEGPLFTRDLHN